MSDGEALQSVRHPNHPDLVERVARAICKVIGVGVEEYWEAHIDEANAAIDAVADWDVEHNDAELSPDSIETIEIEVRPHLAALIEAGRDAVERMSADELNNMFNEQRESWARQMKD